jgi:hypothetical protein
MSFDRHIHRWRCDYDFCDWPHQNKFDGRSIRLFWIHHLPVSCIRAVLLIGLSRIQVASKVSFIRCCLDRDFGLGIIFMADILSTFMMLPNQSPEPTAVAAAVAIHAASRRWLSFFR